MGIKQGLSKLDSSCLGNKASNWQIRPPKIEKLLTTKERKNRAKRMGERLCYSISDRGFKAWIQKELKKKLNKKHQSTIEQAIHKKNKAQMTNKH